jgi:hypothetical protein
MEAIGSSETSVATQGTTRRHIPEDDTLHNHRCKDLKSYITNISTLMYTVWRVDKYKITFKLVIDHWTYEIW